MNITNIRINTPEPVMLQRRVYGSGTSTMYQGISASGGLVAVKVFHKSALAREMAVIEKTASIAIQEVHAETLPLVLAKHYGVQSRTVALAPFITGITVRESIRYRRFIAQFSECSIDAVAVDLALSISLDVCKSLGILHQEVYGAGDTKTRMVHGDLGPKNLITDTQGVTHTIDLGGCLPETQTQNPDAAYCNPFYCSPEQSRVESFDHRSDQFTLGMVLYEIITGNHPFVQNPNSTETAVLHAIKTGTSRELRKFNCSLPKDLENLVRKTLQKDREKRYASITEVEAELKSIQQSWHEKHSPVSFGQAVRAINLLNE